MSLKNIVEAVKSGIQNTAKKPRPNTEIYGPKCKILQSHIHSLFSYIKRSINALYLVLKSHTSKAT